MDDDLRALLGRLSELVETAATTSQQDEGQVPSDPGQRDPQQRSRVDASTKGPEDHE